MRIYDVIVIGSGPAGLTAGIYSSRAELKTLIIAGEKWGGQLMQTTEVENFPGFPKGIQGPVLMMQMKKQAERFGCEIVEKNAIRLETTSYPFTISTSDTEYKARALIVATGANALWLQVPGEKELIGRGVSSCAPCDAFFYKGKSVLVVGGGDTAMEEALVLTKFAKKITIVHRRDTFRASKIMQKRVFKNKKISVWWNTQIVKMIGDTRLEKVVLKTTGVLPKNKEIQEKAHISKENKNYTIWEYPIEGIFVAIGHRPNTEMFKGKLALNPHGYIKRRPETDPLAKKYPTITSVEGIFVAGDVHDFHYRQAITAAGYGCAASMDAQRWLDEKNQ